MTIIDEVLKNKYEKYSDGYDAGTDSVSYLNTIVEKRRKEHNPEEDEDFDSGFDDAVRDYMS